MVDFNEVLKTATDSIERPPTIPVGTYQALVEKMPAIGKAGSNNDWDIIDFSMRLVRPTDDVDQDALKAWGGKITDQRIRHRFMFSKEDPVMQKQSLFNMKRFLEDHLQIETAPGESVSQTLTKAVNKGCLIQIGLRPDKNDPEIQYNQITRTAPLA